MNQLFIETIPFWRKLISEYCKLDLKNIIASKSYYKSDMSLIKDDMISLDGRTKEKAIVLFDLEINKVKFVDIPDRSDNYSNIYECKLELDFYGDDIHKMALDLQTALLSSKVLLELISQNIALNPQIEMSTFDEDINGVSWSRVHFDILFEYEYKKQITEDKIHSLTNLNLGGK